MKVIKTVKGIKYCTMSSAEDGEMFYAMLGRFFCSKEIIKELDGYPIYNNDNYVWIVAIAGTSVVGFYSHFCKGGIIHLDNCYVVPEYRKTGISKTLFSLFLQSNRDKEIRVITKVPSFYEKHGFKAVTQRGRYVTLTREADK